MKIRTKMRHSQVLLLLVCSDLFTAEDFQTTELAAVSLEIPNRFESRTSSLPIVSVDPTEHIVDEFQFGTKPGTQDGGHSTDLAGVARHATLPPPDTPDTETITDRISNTDTISDSYTGHGEVRNAETGTPQQDAIHNISQFTKLPLLEEVTAAWTTVTRLTPDDLTSVEEHSAVQSSPSTSSFLDEQTISESITRIQHRNLTPPTSSPADGETGHFESPGEGSLNLLVSEVVETQISTESVAPALEVTSPGALSTRFELTSRSTPPTSVQKIVGLTTLSHTTKSQETSNVSIELQTTSGQETSGETTPGLGTSGVTSIGLETPGVTTPGLETSGVTSIGLETPGVTTPGLETSGVTSIGLETPGETTPRLGTYGGATSDVTTTSRTTPDEVVISSQAAHIKTSASPSGDQTSQEPTRAEGTSTDFFPTFPDKKLTTDAVHSSSAKLPTTSQTDTHHTAHVSGTHRITESSLNTTAPYTYQPLGGKLEDDDGLGLSAKWMGLGAGVVALLIFFIVTIIIISIKKKRKRESNGGNRFRFTGQSDLIMERYDRQTNKVSFHKKTNGLPSASLPKFESERSQVKDFDASENFGTWRKKSMVTAESFGVINSLPPEVDQDTGQDAMVEVYEKDSDSGSTAEVELRTFSAQNTCYKGFTHL